MERRKQTIADDRTVANFDEIIAFIVDSETEIPHFGSVFFPFRSAEADDYNAFAEAMSTMNGLGTVANVAARLRKACRPRCSSSSRSSNINSSSSRVCSRSGRLATPTGSRQTPPKVGHGVVYRRQRRPTNRFATDAATPSVTLAAPVMMIMVNGRRRARSPLRDVAASSFLRCPMCLAYAKPAVLDYLRCSPTVRYTPVARRRRWDKRGGRTVTRRIGSTVHIIRGPPSLYTSHCLLRRQRSLFTQPTWLFVTVYSVFLPGKVIYDV